MRRILFPALLLAMTTPLITGQNRLNSPNGNIEAVLYCTKGDSFGRPSLTITFQEASNSHTLFENLLTGVRSNRQNLSDSLRLIAVSTPVTISEEYTMISGKKRLCHNQAMEQVYTFENPAGETLHLEVRTYNDGVAFRYRFTSKSEGEVITKEATIYPIAEGVKRWIQPLKIDYEGFYDLTCSGIPEPDLRSNRINYRWAYPLLLEPADSIFVLITEANIGRDQCGSHLNNEADSSAYWLELADKELPVSGDWESPWRLMIIGNLADVVESTLVTDVSEPSKVNDCDWIRPGPAAWIYWAHNNGSNDYQIVKKYIDLAAEMRWPYNLIDWKWNEMANGGNVNDAVQYAAGKGIQTLLWYNSSTSWNGEGAPGPLFVLNEKESRVNEYSKLKEMGVSGIKVDFFNGDGHKEMNYYIDLLEDAIDSQLLINFHGATLPRGWQRTYPHMMTMEAVYGAEWYNNRPLLTGKAARHNATLPFTRNVVGPMDYTPGTFSDSQHPHITSHGHELALTILFESALQHMPDRPESYRSLPAPIRTFLSGLPTTWDETKLLAGYPGESVVLARCKGDSWYIAGINGTEEPLTLTFSPAALAGIHKTITIFSDGTDDRNFTITEESSLTDFSDTIEVECLPRGGFVAIIK